MKCPADFVIACDEEPQCSRCGFCWEHCICPGWADGGLEHEQTSIKRNM